jgi:hypothetical protein
MRLVARRAKPQTGFDVAKAPGSGGRCEAGQVVDYIAVDMMLRLGQRRRVARIPTTTIAERVGGLVRNREG